MAFVAPISRWAQAGPATGTARERRPSRPGDRLYCPLRDRQFHSRQVGEMLGLDYWQTERLLTERHVPLNYSMADLQADRATLDEVLG